MPVHISRQDAQLAAAGCRSLAFTLRDESEEQGNPLVKEGSWRAAQRRDRLAQLFDEHAVSGAAADAAPAEKAQPSA